MRQKNYSGLSGVPNVITMVLVRGRQDGQNYKALKMLGSLF